MTEAGIHTPPLWSSKVDILKFGEGLSDIPYN